eukprot:1715-Amphidinium_carterae.1
MLIPPFFKLLPSYHSKRKERFESNNLCQMSASLDGSSKTIVCPRGLKQCGIIPLETSACIDCINEFGHVPCATILNGAIRTTTMLDRTKLARRDTLPKLTQANSRSN